MAFVPVMCSANLRQVLIVGCCHRKVNASRRQHRYALVYYWTPLLPLAFPGGCQKSNLACLSDIETSLPIFGRDEKSGRIRDISLWPWSFPQCACEKAE